MRPTLVLVSALPLLALTVTAHAADAPTHRISDDVPWALAIDDALSKPLVEQWYGPQVAQAWRDLEPRWEGNRQYTRDSFDEGMLAALGVTPIPAMNYEPSPGVIFVAMDGITLRPTCGNGDSANSALDCSPLVDSEVSFPAFGGNSAAEYQQLRSYYEPFDLVMTSARPPEYLPYTLTVIGGSSGLAGQDNGVCGVANVACDGLKRNHVSLNFPQSCNGMAETAAQETSHNWGLEHTDNPTDLLYPFNNGGFKTFVDECMDISDATGNGLTACGYIHEFYCEAGGGEQQNSFEELMGVFGPRSEDTSAPTIVSTFPPNGAQMGTEDNFTITAHIEDDSRFVGVRWTWLSGLPEGTDSFTRCTNSVCDQDFNPGVSFVPGEIAWDFVAFNQAPVGIYEFQVEVMDAYGNSDETIVTFEVVEGEGAESGEEGGLDDTAGDDDQGDGTGGPGGTAGDASGGPGVSSGGAGGADGGSSSTCSVDRPQWSGAGLLVLMALGLGRRRRD